MKVDIVGCRHLRLDTRSPSSPTSPPPNPSPISVSALATP